MLLVLHERANDFCNYFLFFGESIFPLDFENVLGNCNAKLLTTVGKESWVVYRVSGTETRERRFWLLFVALGQSEIWPSLSKRNKVCQTVLRGTRKYCAISTFDDARAICTDLFDIHDLSSWTILWSSNANSGCETERQTRNRWSWNFHSSRDDRATFWKKTRKIKRRIK